MRLRTGVIATKAIRFKRECTDWIGSGGYSVTVQYMSRRRVRK